jgi:hypothetical protein
VPRTCPADLRQGDGGRKVAGMTLLITVVGWVGAAGVLFAYLLLLRRRVSAENSLYLSLNFLGSACLAVSTSAAHAWPSAAVNLIWLAIGITPLIRARARIQVRQRRPDRRALAEVSADQ